MFGALVWLWFSRDRPLGVAPPPRKSRDGWAYLAEVCGPMRVTQRVVIRPVPYSGLLNYTTTVRSVF